MLKKIHEISDTGVETFHVSDSDLRHRTFHDLDGGSWLQDVVTEQLCEVHHRMVIEEMDKSTDSRLLPGEKLTWPTPLRRSLVDRLLGRQLPRCTTEHCTDRAHATVDIVLVLAH